MAVKDYLFSNTSLLTGKSQFERPVLSFATECCHVRCNSLSEKQFLRWLNTVLQAVSGSSRDGACFKLDKQTWRRKKQWYTEDDFSKSTH